MAGGDYHYCDWTYYGATTANIPCQRCGYVSYYASTSTDASYSQPMYYTASSTPLPPVKEESDDDQQDEETFENVAGWWELVYEPVESCVTVFVTDPQLARPPPGVDSF